MIEEYLIALYLVGVVGIIPTLRAYVRAVDAEIPAQNEKARRIAGHLFVFTACLVWPIWVAKKILSGDSKP